MTWIEQADLLRQIAAKTPAPERPRPERPRPERPRPEWYDPCAKPGEFTLHPGLDSVWRAKFANGRSYQIERRQDGPHGMVGYYSWQITEPGYLDRPVGNTPSLDFDEAVAVCRNDNDSFSRRFRCTST